MDAERFGNCKGETSSSLRKAKTRARPGVSLVSVLAVLALACGCGGKRPSSDAEPVAECAQFETAMNACFGRHSSVARTPALLPKSDADRERIRAMCSENLERIRIACR